METKKAVLSNGKQSFDDGCKGTDNNAPTQEISVKHLKNDVEKLGDNIFSVVEEANEEERQGIYTKDFPFKLITRDSEVEPVTFLFDCGGYPFVEVGRLNAITSIGVGNKSGGGKSHTAYIMLACGITGEVGCLHSPSIGKCVYVEAEMGDSRTMECRRKVEQICNQAGKPFNDDLLVTITYNPEISCTTDKRFEAVKKIIETEKPMLLIFDPLTKLISDDGQGDSSIEENISELKRMAALHGCTIIIVAHGTKADLDEHLNGRVGTLLEQDVSSLITVNHHRELGDDYFEIATSKNRGKYIEPWRWCFVGDDLSEYPYPYAPTPTSMGRGLNEDILKAYIVEAYDKDTLLSRSYLNSRLQDIMKLGKRQVDTHISQAIKSNLITYKESKKQSRYYEKNC